MELKKTTNSLLFGSLALWVIAAYFREQIPSPADIKPSVYTTPSAVPTEKASFNITKNDITYNIQPQYTYELYGLIVSQHNSASFGDLYHEQWKDYINIKDICVVFGDAVKTDIYKRMKFSSGSWTCFAQFSSPGDGAIFKLENMSNNHLLTDDPDINNTVLDTVKGDQIHLKGYIVKYGKGEEPKRGYNIFRLGKGECQVIYLTDFEILNQNPWKFLYTFFKWMTLISLGLWLFRFFWIDKIV